MEELDLPLKGSISWIYGDASAAQKRYNDTCKVIAQRQKNIRKQLLALAPEELHSTLEGAIHRLFAFKSTSIDLKVADYGGEAKTSELIAKLAQAWKGAASVDSVLTDDDLGLKFVVHLHAVQHQ